MNYGMVDPEAPEDASNAEPEAKPSMVVTNNEPDGTGTHPWLALEEMDLPLEVKQLQGLDDESPFVTEAPPSEQTQDPQVSVQQWILDSLGERHEPTLSEMGFIGIHSPRPLLHHRSSLPGMSDPLNQRSYGLQDGLYLRLPPQTHTPNTENFQPLGRSIDSRSRSSSTSKLSKLCDDECTITRCATTIRRSSVSCATIQDLIICYCVSSLCSPSIASLNGMSNIDLLSASGKVVSRRNVIVFVGIY